MNLKTRWPDECLQEEIYKLLLAEQQTPVYDSVPRDAALPYGALEEIEIDKGGDKTAAIYDVSQKIVFYSEYAGKTELNTIVNTVSGILSCVYIDLSAHRFKIISWDVNHKLAGHVEDYGYQQELTFTAKIQDLGGV